MRKRHYLPLSASYLKVKNPIHQRAPATLIDSILPCFLPMEDNTFEPDLIHAIFKLVWSRRALERQLTDGTDAMDCEVGGAGTSKKNRPTSSANGNALKLSCELLRNFITEAVQRAATIAEAEGVNKIEATHLERILPQLLLDF